MTDRIGFWSSVVVLCVCAIVALYLLHGIGSLVDRTSDVPVDYAATGLRAALVWWGFQLVEPGYFAASAAVSALAVVHFWRRVRGAKARATGWLYGCLMGLLTVWMIVWAVAALSVPPDAGSSSRYINVRLTDGGWTGASYWGGDVTDYLAFHAFVSVPLWAMLAGILVRRIGGTKEPSESPEQDP